jgi:hypothetical protein
MAKRQEVKSGFVLEVASATLSTWHVDKCKVGTVTYHRLLNS